MKNTTLMFKMGAKNASRGAKDASRGAKDASRGAKDASEYGTGHHSA